MPRDPMPRRKLFFQRSRPYLPAVFVSILYLFLAWITQLDWELFRDEGMYKEASESFFLAWPGIRITLDICATGVMLWGCLWKVFDYDIAVFRLSVVVVAVLASFLCIHIARALNQQRPWQYMLLLVCLPQYFVYVFQWNCSVLSVSLGLAILITYWAFRPKNSRFRGGAEKRIWTAGKVLLMVLLLAGACITSPFMLAYPIAILLLEGANGIRVKGRFLPDQSKLLIAACLVAIGLWFVFLALTEPKIFESLQFHSRIGVNQGLGPFYPGNLFIFLCYLGGMFPLLPFVFERRVPLKVLLPTGTGCILLASVFLPLNGYAFDNAFHTLFTMVADRVVDAHDVTPIFVNTVYFLLVGLGWYSFIHVLYQGPRDRFYALSLLILGTYMALFLLDGYICSRLYLPGMLGFLFLIARGFNRRPGVFLFQIAYQIAWLVAYVSGLYMKHGFFGDPKAVMLWTFS